MSSGRLVREARLRAGLTQRQLALRTGLSQPAIARIETGMTEPTLRQVERLVEACGLELRTWLVTIDDSDWSVAQANLQLAPEARVRQHQAALRFIRAGREAHARHEPRARSEPAARLEARPRTRFRARSEPSARPIG